MWRRSTGAARRGAGGPSEQIQERTVAASGPVLPPPLDSELLVGMSVETLVAPSDVEPLLRATNGAPPSDRV